MKKVLSLILALVMCLALCACDQNNQREEQSGGAANPENMNTEGIGGSPDLSNQPLIMEIVGEDGAINVAKLRTVVEIVELTTQNWREHFKVYPYSYTEVKEEKDAFGEIVSTDTIVHEGFAFGAGDARYHGYSDVVIELQDKTTGELVIYQSNGVDIEVEADFNLENYECTRIKGSVYYLNVPMGEIPDGIWFWPVFPEEGMAQPGALRIEPGRYSFDTYWLAAWFS